ncbi:MAG: hypothetical protein Q8900_05605 [Bacillota bacterium]|nr:hypothetical protein [Bacillota bacterium]
MKKIVSIILIGIFMFSFASCSLKQNKKSESNKSENVFDIKIAQNIVNVYMGYLIKDDQENIKKMYSKELSSKTKSSAANDLKVLGYKIEDINEIGHTGVFKVNVARSSINKPAAVLDEYTVKVKKEENEYKIDDINSETNREAYNQADELRLRTKGNVKTNLIADTDGIPEYVYPKDDKASVVKIDTPKNNFGMINFSYGGTNLAVSTYNKDSFIGIIKIDESLAVQGGQDESQAGSQSENKGSSSTNIKEPPVGKEIAPVDLLKDSKIDSMVFSLDEKFLVVQYTNALGSKNLRVYYSESGNIIPFKFEDIYDANLYNVVFSSFDNDVLNYEVTKNPKSSNAKEEILGKWQLDLEKFKQKKL